MPTPLSDHYRGPFHYRAGSPLSAGWPLSGGLAGWLVAWAGGGLVGCGLAGCFSRVKNGFGRVFGRFSGGFWGFWAVFGVFGVLT